MCIPLALNPSNECELGLVQQPVHLVLLVNTGPEILKFFFQSQVTTVRNKGTDRIQAIMGMGDQRRDNEKAKGWMGPK